MLYQSALKFVRTGCRTATQPNETQRIQNAFSVNTLSLLNAFD